MRTRCLEAPGRDRFEVAGALLATSSDRGGEIEVSLPLGGHVDLDRRNGPELTPELAEVVAAWPLGATLAAAVAVHGLQVGRRRSALNEALHELRRPLQALAL